MTSAAPLMAGKKGLIMGVANDHSIAWGIAKACHAQGAELAFTYQGDALQRRVAPLAKELGSDFLLPCDVTDADSMDALFASIQERWGKLDFIVHAIAFAGKEALKGKYYDVTAENFSRTLHISVFSFTDVCRRAQPILNEGGSLLTLTYYGGEKFIPHYNVMGVAKAALDASIRYLAMDLGEYGLRVNALSAGPIKTLAASGIGDFRYIMKWNELNSPLKRNITIDDVGNSGMYLLSDLAGGVTGEVHHVDAGYHVNGMINPTSATGNADLMKAFSEG